MKDKMHIKKVKNVADCYSVFDKWFPALNMFDYTDGIFNNDPSTPLEVAHRNQHNYLLDEVKCARGTRILELGCGNGNLLARARDRGALATGVTVCPEQVELCKERGLNVHLKSYFDIGKEYERKFDAVICNGCIEHAVQAGEAARGEADMIYRRLFEICHRVIDPRSKIKRLVNTTIHFVKAPDPKDSMKNPFLFPWGSDKARWSFISHSFGGWYPVKGQFKRCAKGYFRPTKTIDGTHDYHLTSEEWLRRVREGMMGAAGLKILFDSIPLLAKCPETYLTMVTCMLLAEAWNWQFRPPNPPTRLFRQTWQYCG